MLQLLPLDTHNIIISFLSLKEQIKYRTICKDLQECPIFAIKCDNGAIRSDRITEKILMSLIQLEELCLTGNRLLTDINFLVNLQKLCIDGTSDISSNAINKLLNLNELNCNHNYNITFIPSSKITKLSIAFPCNTGDNDIEKLDLHELNCSQNTRITKIKHFKNLKYLTIDTKSGVSIEELNMCTCIEKLSIVKNHDINDISGLVNITHIYIDSEHPLIHYFNRYVRVIVV